MAVFKWLGGSTFIDQGRYGIASDWQDLTTGTVGVATPQAGDTVDITGVTTAGVYYAGAILVFPIAGGYPLIDLYPAQTAATLLNNPNGIVGYSITGQTMNLDGRLGPISLWLENSTLTGTTVNVIGTATLQSYLDDKVGGAINVGTAAAPALLQTVLYGFDTSNVSPTDHVPTTTLSANVTIAGGSKFDVESLPVGGGAVSLNITGTITTVAGGTLVLNDTDNAGVSSTASHGVAYANNGSIVVNGEAGATTSATLLVNTTGTGSITVNGHNAANSATSLTIGGSLSGQNILLTDGTVTVNDASFAISAPGTAGFDVTGGSFTFGDGNGELVLHQAPLTMLVTDAKGNLVQGSNGRTPFTTPISGFGQGDVIALPGKDLAGFGLATYALSYNAATGVLQVQSPASIAGNPPAVLASLTLVGSYDPALFKLGGNTATQELDITYNGEPVTDPLFNIAYYLAHNPDVAASGVDPYQQYMTVGWKQGRDPSALFSTSYYLAHNPGVAASGENPLTHYEQAGWREGRDPSAAFSVDKYLAAYPDVHTAGVDPLAQYITAGQAAGRVAFPAGPDVSHLFAITDTATGASGGDDGTIYLGSVNYLQHQYIWTSPVDVAIAAEAPNVFLHGGIGNDALQVASGSNVIDGSLGSNFLIGASGTDGGTDTFFVDGRAATGTT